MGIPPHVPPGSEEDSLGSFLYLIPKVPKKNFRRMMENDRKILRFRARMNTVAPEDVGRIFVIKYFLADDTVAIFEPPLKNSGVLGGKFLERCRLKKPETNEFYCQADFFTGATVIANMFTFTIFQADEYTLSYMESEPCAHPMSDMQYISDQLSAPLSEKKDALAEAFKSADPSATGVVSYEVVQDALSANDLELNDQVLITLMRRFDTDHTGNIKYKELLGI